MAHKGGDLWPHPMLCFELGVGEALEDKPFEEAPIEIKAFAFLDGETVIVDLWAKLSRCRLAQP